MKLFIAAAFLAGSALARTTPADLAQANYEYSLETLMEEFNLSYTADELDTRRAILQDNLAKIQAHNEAGTSSYVMGVNRFAAMTSAEFKAYYSGYAKSARKPVEDFEAADLSAHVPVSDLPASLDWREKNVVSPVKDQAACGSCWAFSATETLESNVAINTGKLLELAPQMYVSCSPNPNECGGTGGCEGSTQWLAFNYSLTAGLAAETTYPYTGTDSKCRPTRETPAATITGYQRLPTNNYTALMNAVVNVGPIAISAAAEPWQLYSSGVYDGDCGADVDHAIQLVGYGTSSSKDYYLVRNSWGDSWGEEGYIRIARFGDTSGGEKCYTDKTPGDGTGCKGGPSTIQVCGLCGILSDSSYVQGGAIPSK